MSKQFDPIMGRMRHIPNLSQSEIAERGIRSIQRRIANPGMADDCRELALHELKRWRRLLATGGIVALLLNGCTPCPAGEIVKPDFERLSRAIYFAEGGAATRYPYGILSHYKTTTPKQACLNTIAHQWRNYVAAGQRGDFVDFLSKTYAPLNAKNDPTGLNLNWAANVKSLMRGGKTL